MTSSRIFRIYYVLLFSAGVTDFVFRPLVLGFLGPACLLSLARPEDAVRRVLGTPWIGTCFLTQFVIGALMVWAGQLRHAAAAVILVGAVYCWLCDCILISTLAPRTPAPGRGGVQRPGSGDEQGGRLGRKT
jgi:hypothetical protein